ncbi:TetR/AcrR family transcriptional regulator [Pelomonas sp. CA6]|uniref:TetR/AcrR family transcriptional regulator n=1 Tax=Pelomonas sp. CA6 TaxID=2907999 RepID=UPI001F4BF96A|nr:TetR/AcrR family transcriptional regulator [Pelomonas sp. CA6]MCH7344076.1 TetR/AcrR family transcriptional regulator [Pelomonas sp. CA6]
MSSPASPRQRRKEARPQELLDAALALFVEKGFAATRSEEVAARAGVSKGTLYLYYPSKEELFKAVVRESLAAKIAEGAEELARHQGPMAELLVWVMHEWWQRMGCTPVGGIMKIMVSEARNFPELTRFYVDEVILPFCALLAEVLQRGVARGEFRPVDVESTVHVLIGPVLHLVMHQHSIGACGLGHGPKPDPDLVLATQMELMLRGLLRDPGQMPAAVRMRQPTDPPGEGGAGIP